MFQHVRRSQNTEHARVLSYFTNKWKTRFDCRKSLNKNIFFIRKKNPFEYDFLNTNHIYKYIKYKHILFK